MAVKKTGSGKANKPMQKIFADLHDNFDEYTPEEREKLLYQGLRQLSSVVRNLRKGAKSSDEQEN